MRRSFSLSGSTGRSGKTLMWLLVCLVAIATSDAFWSIPMASSGSQLSIVADDDDPVGSESMPECTLNSVCHTHLRLLSRKSTNVHETVAVSGSSLLQRALRGSPKHMPDDRELPT